MNQSFATMSAASILAETASRYPDRVAVIVGETKTTYGELWQQTKSYAGALVARGIKPGSRVAMLIPNVADFPRVYFAILSVGGVVVPVHALLKSKEIAYVLEDSGAELLICAAPLLSEGARGAQIAGVRLVSVMVPESGAALPSRLQDEADETAPIKSIVPRNPDDVATILYTSGTSGTPKGAEGSHFALLEQVNVLLLSTLKLNPSDRVLGALPLFHTFGQTCTMNTVFRAAATLVLLPRFEGDAALRTMNETQCTVFMGVPTMYFSLLDAASRNAERPPLQYCVSGGAALPVATIDLFTAAFSAPIHEGYGLTETSPVATFNHVGTPPRPGTIGTPIWGVSVEIADPDNSDSIVLVPQGTLGELVIRGHNLMNGYHNRPEETAAAILDGWFRTGDLGFKDEDGYLTIVDRTKDMIVRNGYNVYPREVEEVLAKHPDIAMAAVYGVPDATHGEEVVASVVMLAGSTASENELIDFVKAEVAPYKYPRRIFMVDALPLGPSGKVLKRELAANWRSANEPRG